MQTPDNDKFAFIYSTRFWAYVIGAIALSIGPDGIFTTAELYNALMSLVAAFSGTKTIDRIVDKIASAKGGTDSIKQNNIYNNLEI